MILALISGVVLLTVGAELLVRGAARLATAFAVPSLVVGLTVVAFGTSAPEMAVSVGATIADKPGIAMGNVVGSNIFNLLFILGLSALVVPLAVARQIVRLDTPLMVAASVALLLLSLDGRVGRSDGVLLFGSLIGYTWFVVRRQQPGPVPGPVPNVVPGLLPGDDAGAAVSAAPRSRVRLVTLAAVTAAAGLMLLVLGSRWFVEGAVELARLLGVSETVIGLTIIAAGTSLPELATSLLASMRGERDIAVGNIIGSNIFNILAILGVCGILAPGGIVVEASLIGFDIPIMIAVAAATLPILFTGLRVTRAEGALFVAYYAAYAAYLVLQATQHEARDLFGDIVLCGAIPLTAVILLMAVLRGRQSLDWPSGMT